MSTIPGFNEHQTLLVAIIAFNVAAYILMAIATAFLYRTFKKLLELFAEMLKCQDQLQDMTKKVMDENDDFFMILERFDEKFDIIINRQGKLGGIIGTSISEARRHDKKVSHILSLMGETVPNGETDTPGP